MSVSSSPREFTPEEKADAARAVLRELQRTHDARIDYLLLAGGVREICDHYGLPYPLALASVGTLDSLGALSAAVDEYAALCEKQFPSVNARAVTAPGAGSAAAPAVGLAA